MTCLKLRKHVKYYHQHEHNLEDFSIPSLIFFKDLMVYLSDQGIQCPLSVLVSQVVPQWLHLLCGANSLSFRNLHSHNICTWVYFVAVKCCFTFDVLHQISNTVLGTKQSAVSWWTWRPRWSRWSLDYTLILSLLNVTQQILHCKIKGYASAQCPKQSV